MGGAFESRLIRVSKQARIGVLALQGAFREHAAALRALGADVVEVRLPEELEGLDGLDEEHLDLADLVVDRNAFGRQVRSFEADVDLAGDPIPLRGVFIRAPRIRSLGDGVEVVGTLDGEPVLVRDGRFLLASFHPELTEDLRVHQLFLTMVEEASSVRA